MEFFSSLAKAEQNAFSEVTMAFAGPSKENLHIGALAAAMKRNAEINGGIEEDEDDIARFATTPGTKWLSFSSFVVFALILMKNWFKKMQGFFT